MRLSAGSRAAALFALFWVALFLLYLPAARAGWVSDTLGWLEAVQRQSFPDFVSRKGFGVRSFYQLTQIITWTLYQVFGTSRWAWHLLHLSLHALNATLLFLLLRGILTDSRFSKPGSIAFVVAALFCVSPYVSEVIVWEAAYHFLQGMLLILAQALLLRRYLHTAKWIYAVAGVSLFAISAFSLELFYLTPPLGMLVCAYYRVGLGWNSARVKSAILRIILPQAAIVVLHLMAAQIFLGTTTGRLGNAIGTLPLTYYLVKPPENLFHLFGGRFLPQAWRNAVYEACSSYVGAGLFYLAIAGVAMFIMLRFRKMQARSQLLSVAFLWLLAGLLLVSPLWFPQRLLITGDRYLYALLPPFFLTVVLAGMRIVKSRAWQGALASGLLIFQMPFTFSLNRTWAESERTTARLACGLSDAPGKLTILLNSPASLRGAPMIGAGEDGEAVLLHNLLCDSPSVKRIADAPALHMLREDDRVHFEFLDERTLKVSLTRHDAFWQWGPDIARSFQTPDFSIEVNNANCCYTLTLHRPPPAYRLLYQKSGAWHELHFTLP